MKLNYKRLQRDLEEILNFINKLNNEVDKIEESGEGWDDFARFDLINKIKAISNFLGKNAHAIGLAASLEESQSQDGKNPNQ